MPSRSSRCTPATFSQDRYADAMLARLQEIVAARQIAALKSKLQRINPQEQPEEHARLFGELISLESHRRIAARAGDRLRRQF